MPFTARIISTMLERGGIASADGQDSDQIVLPEYLPVVPLQAAVMASLSLDRDQVVVASDGADAAGRVRMTGRNLPVLAAQMIAQGRYARGSVRTG
ncbi:hypothetical protein [Anianabacter salinae]|uniref:hypothetical protein n=1 Tax=Anianabacter salinae TaxID=2851023 RepID=UPI00225E142E|nr:hypothetical protein [Anianabacter salinae]MBV0912410.1 hypothetical protein [Anianabacter salinae]